jgi:hypothetical protein
MDLLMLQLPALSPRVVQFSQDRLPTLERAKEGVITSDVEFGDSGVGKSMSSQVQSSPISEDGGFINQSPIPRRFHLQEDLPDDLQNKTQGDTQMEAVFEKQQRDRQWLASQVTKQHQEEGQEIAEFEEQLRK